MKQELNAVLIASVVFVALVYCLSFIICDYDKRQLEIKRDVCISTLRKFKELDIEIDKDPCEPS